MSLLSLNFILLNKTCEQIFLEAGMEAVSQMIKKSGTMSPGLQEKLGRVYAFLLCLPDAPVGDPRDRDRETQTGSKRPPHPGA